MSARPDGAGEPVGTFNLVECLEPWFNPVQVAVSVPVSTPEPVHAAMDGGAKLRRPTPPKPAQIAATVAVSVQAAPKAQAPEPSPMDALPAMLKRYGRTVDECMQIGRTLLLLKASVPHGEFGPALDGLGLCKRTGQRYTSSAKRFSRYPQVRKHCFNESMLFELLPLNDAQLDELERTGCVDGLRLDDMAGMTLKQLSQAVRAVRAGVDPRHIDAGMLRLQAKLRKLDKPH